MRNPEDHAVVVRLKRLSQIEPSGESIELALGHARAALANLPAATAGRPPEPARPWNQISHWMGGLTMRQRIAAFGGVGVAALSGFLLLWGGIGSKPVSAMEQMAAAIRQVKSCKCTEVVQQPELRPEFLTPGKPPPRVEWVFTIYWLAPGSVRDEHTTFPQIWKGSPETTEIRSEGKPGIIISHSDKTFFRTRPLNKGFGFTGCETLEDLAKLSGKADRELGTREINGKKARGFQIDMKKIGADSMPGTREIWIDAQSSLPVLVRDDKKWPDNSDHSLIIKDIQYNIDLDPKLFDTTPPEGYRDTTGEPLPLEEQVRRITRAMKICAEVFGGCYPATHGDLVRAVFGEVKAKLISGNSQQPAKMNTAKAPEALQHEVRTGLREVLSIRAYNPDPAYYGQTVGPKDKDKVLLRWKLDDGRYEVIFGDLRAETVTAERLHNLEGK
jgi:outer membrane lipoprotein-sorting protein